MRYTAIIRKEDGAFLVEFPDCPGCQTFAENTDEIAAMAQEALEGWLEAHLVDGKAPPRPTVREAAPEGAKLVPIPVNANLSVALSLRWARQDANLSQKQLAERAGVSQQQIAKLEHPDENPTIGTLQRVAKALGLHVDVDITEIESGLKAEVSRSGVAVKGSRSLASSVLGGNYGERHRHSDARTGKFIERGSARSGLMGRASESRMSDRASGGRGKSSSSVVAARKARKAG